VSYIDANLLRIGRVGILMILVSIVVPGSFAESAPLLLNSQGRLTNSVGTPVTSPQLVTL
jgi:hypothetical protein